MEGSRRGRPRNDNHINGKVLDDTIYLALIWKAGGNVSKAAMDLGHEGTRSFYTARARLRKHVNADKAQSDPDYDALHEYDGKSRKSRWTEAGLRLVKAGQELLRTKQHYDDEEEKMRRENFHLARCRTPLFANTEIIVAPPDRESEFEIFYVCRSCDMLMRNISTVEFMKWREEHPEVYSAANRVFLEIRIPSMQPD